MALDHTHDPSRRSRVASANDGTTDFPIQNLPLGVFATPASGPRCGVAIGDRIFDLHIAADRGLICPLAAEAVKAENLDALLALGRPALRALRHDVFAFLDVDRGTADEGLLHPMVDCALHLPTSIRNFTDYFAGIHHAVRCGEITGRADDPLPANYHHLPIGYNGGASTARASGVEVRRPLGLRKRLGEAEPSFGASRWLDFELELGLFIGPGNPIGEPIALAEASAHIMGFCLLNDWAARDIQLFDMVPVGPLNSKSFITSISPRMVTGDAMEPFRALAMRRLPHTPPLATYLDDAADQQDGVINVALSAAISTARMRASASPPASLLETHARYLYWTCAQMIAHQSVNGCSLTPGDRIGTGTISGPTQDGYASLSCPLAAKRRSPCQMASAERSWRMATRSPSRGAASGPALHPSGSEHARGGFLQASREALTPAASRCESSR